MSHQQGVVVAVEGDEMVVELPPRGGGCGQCHKPGGCQAGLLGDAATPQRIRLPARVGLRAGDAVKLEMADGQLWHAAMSAYGAPLLLALAGAAAAQALWGGDLAAVAGLLAGLAGGLLILRRGELRARGQGCRFMLQKI